MSASKPNGNISVVFISSTVEDLKPYRAAAEHGAKTARFFPVMQEYFVARDNPPLKECLERVSQADVVVVIVAHRYGWVPPVQPENWRKSITWLECERAVKEGKEVLAFLVDEGADWPLESHEEYALVAAAREGRARDLVDKIQQNMAGLRDFKAWLSSRGIRVTFKNPEDLRSRVSDALHDWRERHPEYRMAPPGEFTEADPTDYLEYLRDETAHIDIRGLQVGEGEAHRFPIGDLYIPLEDELGEEPHRARTEGAGAGSRGRLPLDKALGHSRLVVVGDPGAGKTTFLRRIANALCESLLGVSPAAARDLPGMDQTPFPVLAPVAELAEFIDNRRSGTGPDRHPAAREAPTWLPQFLGARSEELGLGLDESYFRRRIAEGPCLVLLDGLDEAPSQEAREALSRLVERAARRWTNCRFAVTTRPQAYAGEVVLEDFHQARIGGLEPEAIRTFLRRWSGALHPDSARLAKEHSRELVEAVECRREIRQVARNPVMLTALAVLHWNEKRLPEQRADLYESILTWLARSRKRRGGRPSPERCIAMLQELARAMQADPKGRQVQAPREWAAGVLAPRFRELKEDDERLQRARGFLKEEELDSGIVVSRGPDVRFWHLTFQEYLAARALDGLPDAERNRLLFRDRRAWLPEWREVVLLLAGILHQRSAERADALVSAALEDLYRGSGPRRVLQWLGAQPKLAEQARCAGLLGAILQDLRPLAYQPVDKRYQQVLDAVLGIFDARKSEGIELSVRLEAAEAVAQAGDPRLRHPQDNDYWVTIPAGTFQMGAQSKDPAKGNYDPEANADESPVHVVELNAFQIGRCPVTVEEYGQFLKDEGYGDQQWWKGGGFGQKAAPGDWEEQMRHRSRPVVNVTWYEAAAYCAWAGGRLPTEAEWERAARGTEGRKYPWGNEAPDASRANYGGTTVGHASPVGLFPRGKTPEGMVDMAGNVWEWVADWYADDYHGKSPRENPPGPKRGDYRVLRGGSWFYPSWLLRSARRLGLAPVHWYVGFGFRCAREVTA